MNIDSRISKFRTTRRTRTSRRRSPSERSFPDSRIAYRGEVVDSAAMIAASRQEIVLVVARADNGAIGKDNKLPWHLPADLKHFKRVTMNAPMIMGRRTFESLPGLLPGRRHIVLTRNPGWSAPGAELATSVTEALAKAATDRVSVIGGAEIFRLFEPLAAAVELTEVHLDADGDVFMPPFDPVIWTSVSSEFHAAEDHRPAFTFRRLERSPTIPKHS